MSTRKQVMSNTMVFYHFKSSVLGPESPATELKFNTELHVGHILVSQTET